MTGKAGARLRWMLASATVLGAIALGTAPAARATHTPGCGNHQGEPLLLGCENQATTGRTMLQTPTVGAMGLLGWNIATTGKGKGLMGASNSNVGTGVIGAAGTASWSNFAEGAGVFGNGPKNGVYGSSLTSTGNGVTGSAFDSGVGVVAQGSSSGTGAALKVSGRAIFSRSGKVFIPAGSASMTQTNVPLTSASLVLATVQNNLAGVWVTRAVPNVAGSSFTVFLNTAVPAGKTVTVAWFVVN